MLTLSYDGHQLLAVPAVHYRAVFAEMVQLLCSSPETRPDAIAVELDPAAAAGIAAWFRDLSDGSRPRPLPCMLGLIRENRRIHPRYKKKVLELQETYGRLLHEIPQGVLFRELEYAPTSLLCLSPTDSIIEAIRSAVELQVPLYGIDLDDPAARIHRGTLDLQ